MPLASYELGDGLLTVLSIFFLIIWIWILIFILTDLFRDHELSGWAKAIWLLFLVFLTPITALVYLIARGGGMRDRAIAAQAEAQKQMDDYVRQTVSSGSTADELAKLAELHKAGSLSDADYEAAKAKVLAQ
ncbi:MAG: SHOCT domain-containing protein [Solirubrobacteraceae bacterium]|jgi:ABC-type transport system involved in cytochrome bd biosynthesis fused ATPase/permease subunit|nr:SHOCT domain-containing protein [Solirubrobacteraceae bacterium]